MNIVEIAYTLGANPRQVMTDVALRAMGPTLVDNLRITLGWCWTYLIIAEIVAADSGIGFVIWTARRYVKTPEVMAGVVVIGIIGLVTDQLLRLLHRRGLQVPVMADGYLQFLDTAKAFGPVEVVRRTTPCARPQRASRSSSGRPAAARPP